ncbi:hypothetical protein BDN72DRAFT_852294 [Pluteus cervinus]|uniref:Uncharacterized protein n=1 Tax=Pluteus cervinus TaxID=181527 RepID=A0ACD3BHE7_9AGAR|nr:hypothetical protein BDN72DRAFT_852294 [Pluteus cervinus]
MSSQPSSSQPPATETPAEIDRATIELVLRYLSPLPTTPIPPHLVSQQLLQRHHFLSLDPASDVLGYLSWPSADAEQISTLLQSLSLDDLPPAFSVRYSSDQQATFAHVRITTDASSDPALRLVFLWHPTNHWQYHNIALMPFPSDSFISFDHRDPLHVVAQQDDDDAYWNSYAQHDSPSHSSLFSSQKREANMSEEDAYWAQYASVQGSADSTIPSPLPQTRKLVQPQPIRTPDPIYNPLQPPSPSSLARRLEKLSSRSDSPPLIDDTNTSATASDASPFMVPSEEPIGTHQYIIVDEDENPPISPSHSPTDEALKQTIQGIYRMWKTSRPPHQRDDQDAFLRIVQDALAGR